jgi:hypothetical protein
MKGSLSKRCEVNDVDDHRISRDEMEEVGDSMVKQFQDSPLVRARVKTLGRERDCGVDSKFEASVISSLGGRHMQVQTIT